ncbi:hypothetical protein ACFSCZ_01615 [Siminovitchia sediminis]|uniref:Uncharacterized protein n=1 Tax=Siminovitchia sediminis TaxID=1274353 RepID=A0ABW4KH01_9BACI
MEQFLPILVIALISFFVNRANEQKKRANQENKKTPNRPVQPKQTERKPAPVRPEPVSRPVAAEIPRSLKEAAEILLSEMQPQIEKKKSEAENQYKKLEKEAESLKRQAEQFKRKAEAAKEKMNEHKTEAPSSPASPVFFQQDDIVKGIIMSEVLGPPRAKRRYSRLR